MTKAEKTKRTAIIMTVLSSAATAWCIASIYYNRARLALDLQRILRGHEWRGHPCFNHMHDYAATYVKVKP